MQTFLPYPNFTDSARCLDMKRLGKQRVEAYQILLCLQTSNKWKNHPAVKMWEGYQEALKHYLNMMIFEWVRRGYRNTMKYQLVDADKLVCPPFVGQEMFHSAHRSNLLRKDFEFYSRFGWKESNNLPYYWPTHHENNIRV